ALDGVIARAMAKDIGERFGTCGELMTAARQGLASGRTVHAPPPMPGDRRGAGAVPPMPPPAPAPTRPQVPPRAEPPPVPARTPSKLGGEAPRAPRGRAASLVPVVVVAGAAAVLLLAGLVTP